MKKTAAGHNMLWINGDKVGLEVIKILRSMYGDRLVYPVKDLTPPMIPEYYYVIFSIDGEELDISCEFGDYVLASFSDKADVFVEEIEMELKMRFGIFKKANKKSFDYEKFEKNLLIAVEEYVKLKLDNKDDLYIMSIEYFPEFTTFVAIRANTYSYLKEKVGENEKYYTYYKYCEEEWELCECLEEVSNDLQAEYKEMEAKYEDAQFEELQAEHAAIIFTSCKAVMKKFKETDTYKKLSKPYLNVYIRERLTKEERVRVFCELNGEDNSEEYSEWL